LNSNHRFSAQKIARSKTIMGLKKKKKVIKQKAYPIILRSYSLAPLAIMIESTFLFIPAVTLDLFIEEL